MKIFKKNYKSHLWQLCLNFHRNFIVEGPVGSINFDSECDVDQSFLNIDEGISPSEPLVPSQLKSHIHLNYRYLPMNYDYPAPA